MRDKTLPKVGEIIICYTSAKYWSTGVVLEVGEHPFCGEEEKYLIEWFSPTQSSCVNRYSGATLLKLRAAPKARTTYVPGYNSDIQYKW